MRHKAPKLVETSSNVPYCKAVRIRDDARNLVGPRKSARSVCPRKWRETTVLRKACAPASPGPKYQPEWCLTSRTLHAHPGYMKFMEIERNFLGLKMARHGCCEARNAPRRSPDVRHKAQKLVETSSYVPYCQAVRIRDGAPNFGRAPKTSPERVL